MKNKGRWSSIYEKFACENQLRLAKASEKANEINEQKLEFEKETKDRVDISKKEYAELLRDREAYAELRKRFENIFGLLADNEVLYDKLVNGEIDETRLSFSEDVESRKKKCKVVFVVDIGKEELK